MFCSNSSNTNIRLIASSNATPSEASHAQPSTASRSRGNGAGAWLMRSAIAAGELLADVLDHLPPPRNDLQRLGGILPSSVIPAAPPPEPWPASPRLGQPRSAAAGAGRRPGHDHSLARQVLGERLARAALAAKPNFTAFSTQVIDMIPTRPGALSTRLPT